MQKERIALFGITEFTENFIVRFGAYYYIDVVLFDGISDQNKFCGIRIKSASDYYGEKGVDYAVICDPIKKDLYVNQLKAIGFSNYQIYQFFGGDSVPNIFWVSAFENIPHKPHHIVSITLPKSGSMWLKDQIYAAIRLGDLNLRHTIVHGADLPSINNPNPDRFQLNRECLKKLVAGGGIAFNHIYPNDDDLFLLKSYGVKSLINFRDPRQALISWYHHVKNYIINDPVESKLYGYDETYYSSDHNTQIEYLIENFYPFLVSWVTAWFSQIESFESNLILVMNHERLVSEPDVCQSRIERFLDLPRGTVNLKNSPTPNVAHFRKGLSNEWKSVLNKDQQKRITEKLPTDIMNFFGWDR